MTSFPLFLMRHGAPTGPGRLIGHLDATADPDAMPLCVERVRGLDFAQVVSSDLARATAPGAIIAAERGLPHHADPRWRELHFGAWEGADPASLPRDDLARFWDDPDGSPPPQGERWADLRARVAAGLGDVNGPTLIVSHAGAIRAAISILCGFAYTQSWAVDLPYAALVTLRVWPGETASAQITGLTT